MERQYEQEFARRHYALGRSAGRREGRQEGRQEGLRTAALVLARAHLGSIGPDEAAAIAALQNEAALSALIEALAGGGSVLDARAALDAALAGH